jgi:hypothetical protein
MIERNNEIVRLWNLEIPSKDIAAQLGITKNTVIGVVTRTRNSGSGLITRGMKPGPYQNMQNGKRSHRKRPGAEKVKFYTRPRLFQKDPEPILELNLEGGIPFMSLGHGHCRYPVARKDEQHFFCGQPRRDTLTSYCEEHHAICHTRKVRLKPEDLIRLKKGYAIKQWISGADAAYRKSRNL